MKLKLGLPKGSLQNATFSLFKKAGWKLQIRERSYFPYIDDEDLEIILIRAQEIPHYVAKEVLDAGITGYDWICEARAKDKEKGKEKVKEVAELLYAKQGLNKVKWVLCVPQKSKFHSPQDLAGKRISTELVQVTKNYFQKKAIPVEVEFSWGATEIKPPYLCDAIVELTETGSSIRANNLKIIDVVIESTTRIIANPSSLGNNFKKTKIENITMLLQGALNAEERVGMKMNVPKNNLQKIISCLPSITSPTVSNLVDDDWVAVETIIEEKKVREIIPHLKKLGASGIIEYSLNKIVY